MQRGEVGLGAGTTLRCAAGDVHYITAAAVGWVYSREGVGEGDNDVVVGVWWWISRSCAWVDRLQQPVLAGDGTTDGTGGSSRCEDVVRLMRHPRFRRGLEPAASGCIGRCLGRPGLAAQDVGTGGNVHPGRVAWWDGWTGWAVQDVATRQCRRAGCSYETVPSCRMDGWMGRWVWCCAVLRDGGGGGDGTCGGCAGRCRCGAVLGRAAELQDMIRACRM